MFAFFPPLQWCYERNLNCAACWSKPCTSQQLIIDQGLVKCKQKHSRVGNNRKSKWNILIFRWTISEIQFPESEKWSGLTFQINLGTQNVCEQIPFFFSFLKQVKTNIPIEKNINKILFNSISHFILNWWNDDKEHEQTKINSTLNYFHIV